MKSWNLFRYNRESTSNQKPDSKGICFDKMFAVPNHISRLAAVVAFFLAAFSVSCSQNVVRTMIPSPILMQDERLDFSRVVLPEERTTEVSVLFATTRAPAPPDAPERYTSRPGDAVRT